MIFKGRTDWKPSFILFVSSVLIREGVRPSAWPGRNIVGTCLSSKSVSSSFQVLWLGMGHSHFLKEDTQLAGTLNCFVVSPQHTCALGWACRPPLSSPTLKRSLSVYSLPIFFFLIFIYLLGCTGSLLLYLGFQAKVAASRGHSLVVVCRLIAVASLVAEHRL